MTERQFEPYARAMQSVLDDGKDFLEDLNKKQKEFNTDEFTKFVNTYDWKDLQSKINMPIDVGQWDKKKKN